MPEDDIVQDALKYHRQFPPGKLGVIATKPLGNQRDLALAYSPGVAAACEAIVADEQEAASVTARGNLVAVVSNGTAVLGLGAIGPLASKPVMEGKAVLFKKFAGIDVFDIEVDALEPEKFCDVVAALEPTFGAINLEDIKAPECFVIEQTLRERMNIPVFHDDQHGTAICVAAAVYNGLQVVGKDIGAVKLVASGAGAAALACLDLLVSMGLKVENTWVTDIEGVVYEGRKELMDDRKARYAKKTDARTLGDVIGDADVFLGLSAPRVLKPEMVKLMGEKPIIMALANPTPEILPEEAKAVRPDAIIATGRSDYPNQVNNVLCFPFIFRGALDVGATTINEEMKIACVKAIANLARAEGSDVVERAYGDQTTRFGPEYLIPKPFDPRLMTEVAPAVAQAAIDSGVATRPYESIEAYKEHLGQFVWQTGLVMRPVFETARSDPKRVVFTDGEARRVLHACQVIVDEGIAVPSVIGREAVIAQHISDLGLRIEIGKELTVIDPLEPARCERYGTLYHDLMARKGVSPEYADSSVRGGGSLLGALMVEFGEADAMITGVVGQYRTHLENIVGIIGKRDGVQELSALTLMVMPDNMFFLADTHVTPDPTTDEIVEMALLAAEEVRRFGLDPNIALLSFSNFGTRDEPSALKMREAVAVLHREYPELAVDGEMHADAALNPILRNRVFPRSKLVGVPNLLIMPNLDAANIAFNLIKALDAQTVPVGPLLIGTNKPAHIVTPSISARGLVNMTALSVVDAQAAAAGH